MPMLDDVWLDMTSIISPAPVIAGQSSDWLQPANMNSNAQTNKTVLEKYLKLQQKGR